MHGHRLSKCLVTRLSDEALGDPLSDSLQIVLPRPNPLDKGESRETKDACHDDQLPGCKEMLNFSDARTDFRRQYAATN